MEANVCGGRGYLDLDLSIAFSSLLSRSSFSGSRDLGSCRRFSSPSSSDFMSELTEEVLWPWRPPDRAAGGTQDAPFIYYLIKALFVFDFLAKFFVAQRERCSLQKYSFWFSYLVLELLVRRWWVLPRYGSGWLRSGEVADWTGSWGTDTWPTMEWLPRRPPSSLWEPTWSRTRNTNYILNSFKCFVLPKNHKNLQLY